MSEALWVNLKILSKLQPFQRINTRGALFKCDQPRMLRIPEFLDRWISGATRDSDFNRIRDLYTMAKNTIGEQDEKLKRHLVDSTKGLESLQKTYENDIMMKARIDTLLEEVKEMIEQLA